MTANVDIIARLRKFSGVIYGRTVEETGPSASSSTCLQNKVIHMIDQEIEHYKSWRTSLYWIKNELFNRQKIMEN